MTYPEFGTAKIECSKRKCGWTGLETELIEKKRKNDDLTQLVCPACGCDSYYFVDEEKK